MKALFSIPAIFFGIYFGKRKAKRFKQRRIILFGMYEDIARLMNLMEYKRLPILYLMELLMPCNMTKFWNLFKEKTLETTTLYEAYSCTIQSLADEFNVLTTEDKAVFEDFFSSLGKGDIDTEIKNASLALKRMEALKNIAFEAELKNSKMYSTLGLISGLAITLLIL